MFVFSFWYSGHYELILELQGCNIIFARSPFVRVCVCLYTFHYFCKYSFHVCYVFKVIDGFY